MIADDHGTNGEGSGVIADDKATNADVSGAIADDKATNGEGSGVEADEAGMNGEGSGVEAEGSRRVAGGSELREADAWRLAGGPDARGNDPGMKEGGEGVDAEAFAMPGEGQRAAQARRCEVAEVQPAPRVSRRRYKEGPMLHAPRTLLPALALSLAAAACGGAAVPPRGEEQGTIATEQTSFPTREAIAQIAAAPVPSKLLDDRSKDVPTWDLTGPLPDALERTPPTDDSPWGKLFAEVAAAHADTVVPTEAMHCVARENAAFYLANDAQPAELLERFIVARCGATNGLAGTMSSLITGDPRTPDATLLAKFRDRMRARIEKSLQGGHVEAGFAFVRNGGRAVVALSVAPETVRLERTPLVPGPDGNVVIRGETVSPATALRALVNRGRYGYAHCDVSPASSLPRFTISCPVARDDEVAWLAVSAVPPGRILGTPLLEMLAWPSGSPGKTYAKIARAAGDAATSTPADLLQEINRVRTEANLPLLRLADEESRTADRLAPHYFAAEDGAANQANQVALGLIAGWDVDGMVRNAHFVSMFEPDAASWAEVVRAAISRPVGREALLDPSAERVAVGTFASGRARAAIFSTYALFDSYRHDGDPARIAASIAALRALRRTSPPRFIAELMADAQRAADSVQVGRRATGEALQDMMHSASARLGGRPVRGWVAETTSLERLRFPAALSESPALALGIGVSHHRRQGSAWGTFLVYIVIVDESVTGPNTARREGAGAAG